MVCEFVARFIGKQGSQRWKKLADRLLVRRVLNWDSHSRLSEYKAPALSPCSTLLLGMIAMYNIWKWKVKYLWNLLWVCTLAKLSSSAIYFYLCHWWLEYISGGKMSTFSFFLCYDFKKKSREKHMYIFFNFNPRQRCEAASMSRLWLQAQFTA